MKNLIYMFLILNMVTITNNYTSDTVETDATELLDDDNLNSVNVITIQKGQENNTELIKQQCKTECEANGKKFTDDYVVIPAGQEGYDSELPSVECTCI
ncbi:MAG: hypothetical protein P4L22_04125 [Candidatus Babeliales bacterium]|nr:hypothetical protein [Candidatus Babeliales bacterium]